MRRWILKGLFSLLLLCVVERFCYWQTHGFRMAKVVIELDEEEGLPPLDPALREALQRPLHFLGSGVQCYAFATEDGRYVLKLFKHFHAGLTDARLRALDHLLGEGPWTRWIDALLAARRERVASIYKSCRLAAENYREETGLLYLHLKRDPHLALPVTLVDRIGIRRTIDLNTLPFVLQKKALLLQHHLDSLPSPSARSEAVAALFALMVERTSKGIEHTDPACARNVGFVGATPIEIDIGSFRYAPGREKGLFYESLALRSWLAAHYPGLETTLDEALAAHLARSRNGPRDGVGDGAPLPQSDARLPEGTHPLHLSLAERTL